MRGKLFALLTALLALVAGAPAYAANLVINGDFEMLTMTSGNSVHSTIIGDGTNGLPTSTGWRSSAVGGRGPGYNFIMVDNPGYAGGSPGPQQTLTGADDQTDGAYTDGNAHVLYDGSPRLQLWGPDYPGTPSTNQLTNSPTGGNFLVADGSYLNRPVEQTIVGLTPGQTYDLSFYWAAGQQAGFDGDTKEAWVVCLGTCSYTTKPGFDEALAFYDADIGNTDPSDPRLNDLGNYDPLLLANGTDQIFKTSVVTTPSHGFTPWRYETFTFTATSSTATLSLLAYGTPVGQPPFSLIDGISIDTSTPVPEPTTWAMMLLGFGLVGGVMRTRRRSFSERRALNAQII